MLTKDFSYNLPEDLIAQNPADQRGASRMLLLEKGFDVLILDSFINSSYNVVNRIKSY